MIEVYVSHIGAPSLFGIEQPLMVNPGTLRSIIEQIESHYPGFREETLDSTKKKLNSATMAFKQIDINADGRILEGKDTKQIRDLDGKNGTITDEDKNLLIALFQPERVVQFLLETLTNTGERFEYANGNMNYRAYISGPDDRQSDQQLFSKAETEKLYPFVNGRPISELITDGLINVNQNKLIPEALQDAISEVWDIKDDFSLRLFQEEALIHILNELARPDKSARKPLLLSIPTGGGKTEAFLIPLIAYLYDQREKILRTGGIPKPIVRSIIVYPTRALANDQARRIAEILYQMNCKAIEDRKISVGVLTGDTPNSSYNFLTEKSLLQICPRCSAVLTTFTEKKIQDSSNPITIARCICGTEIDYFRLTRRDILNYPPDILITSPDMINYTLQSPQYHNKIYLPEVDLIVFDEIHMYESIFGCNVAHLLRRFEEASQCKPMYIGVSATIRNAKELACMIFNADLKDICYLRAKREDEPETPEARPYLDYTVGPARYRHHYAMAPAEWESNHFQKVTTSVRSIANVIGHLTRDPHFRKTLVFSNFRQDTDDIIRFLRDFEDRYYTPYYQKLLPRLQVMRGAQGSANSLDLTKTEAMIVATIDRWYKRAMDMKCIYTQPLIFGWHRGGLEREERIKAVNRFASTQYLTSPDKDNSELPIDIMVATKTLELGIDIGDVTTVINCRAPFTTNEYTQRVGRGGRRKDSLALTIIDPLNPLDFYFLNHFERYANPTLGDFEDAPIIISNLEIFKSHVYARLLDKLAHYMGNSGKDAIRACDLNEFDLFVAGSYIRFIQDWQKFSEALFNEIFNPTVIKNLLSWIHREAEIIPDIQEADVNISLLREWWMAKCEQLYRRICSTNPDIRETDFLSGLESKDRELVPDMRNSGPTVGLYLMREGGEDELRDTISRRQAINSRPVGGYATQGSVSFKVEDVKNRDSNTEERIRLLLAQNAKAVEYFSKMFGDEDNHSPFPNTPLEVLIKVSGFVTPQDLLVKYSPYRFYCPICGATYSDKRSGDDRCMHCHSELRQLNELYVCGGCGELYLPPVPKVCLNPTCVDQAQSPQGKSFKSEGYKEVGKWDRHNYYFRFTALPMLLWKCRKCETEINFHAFYELPKIVQTQVAGAQWGTTSPEQITKSFLYKPESWWGKTYEKDGFYPARYNCPKCKKAGGYKKIQVKNIPSFRSVVNEYIIHGKTIAPERSYTWGMRQLERVSVIALAREHFRRFYSHNKEKDDNPQIDLKRIFPDSNSYLANTFDTHAVFFQFNDKLDEFLENNTFALSCGKNLDCTCNFPKPKENNETEDRDDSDEYDMAHPTAALLSWEKNRKPDPRRKWCQVIQGLKSDATCPGQDVPCNRCQFFNRKHYLRYLILHTLKHGIIIAMPKYTGANKNQLRGLIYQNDEQDYQLSLIDLIEGGSGCLFLLHKNWDQIWEVVGEVLNVARSERGQMFLPYTCFRYNRDLCPHLTFEFYQYLTP